MRGVNQGRWNRWLTWRWLVPFLVKGKEVTKKKSKHKTETNVYYKKEET